MASGIESLLSATTRPSSVPPGREARSDSPRSRTDHPSVDEPSATGRPAFEEDPAALQAGETRQVEKDTLVSLLKRVEGMSLASRTVIYYARDDQSGRMYLYVKDRRTGEELYRIPKDYLPVADESTDKPGAEESLKVDLRI